MLSPSEPGRLSGGIVGDSGGPSSAVRKWLALSLLLAAGIVLYMIESLYFPPLPIPGAKLGLANIVTLLILALYSWRDCIFNVVARTVLGSLITGTFLTPPFFFSLVGAAASTMAMIIVYKLLFGRFSLVGVSLVGAVAHNLAQLWLALYILGHVGIFLQLSLLIWIAVATGTFNGVVANYTARRVAQIERALP